MDLEAAFAEQSAIETVSDNERKILMIAPASVSLPDDGILKYSTAESVYDFKSLEPRTVVCIEPEHFDMMRVVVDNQQFFDVTLRVLTGLPGSEYTPDFDRVVWALDKVAYAPLVSEMALEYEAAEQRKKAGQTIHDKERAQVTRADGTVKAHTAFDEADDSIADES